MACGGPATDTDVIPTGAIWAHSNYDRPFENTRHRILGPSPKTFSYHKLTHHICIFLLLYLDGYINWLQRPIYHSNWTRNGIELISGKILKNDKTFCTCIPLVYLNLVGSMTNDFQLNIQYDCYFNQEKEHKNGTWYRWDRFFLPFGRAKNSCLLYKTGPYLIP